jgi:aryl-alcohol dehydrogenase-like predicted oxidoreductase
MGVPSIIEGTKASLSRLGLDYVDVIFAHRPDATVPMEETVRAFNYVIDKGWAFYWATSEWSAHEIEEAHHVSNRLGLIAPIAEQCKHHMLDRQKPEGEYAPLYRKYKMGTTVFSALAGGLLTGKYNNGVPEGSRFEKHSELPFIKAVVNSFGEDQGKTTIEKLQKLNAFAEKGA